MADKTGSPKATVACPFCSTLNRVSLGRIADRPKCGECGKPLLLDRPIKVTDNDFQKVIASSDVPVIVDFYADWCGPCKVMAPVLDDLARERAGEVLLAKLDTDRNQQVASSYEIRGIPTLVAFVGGQEVAREVGAVPRPQIENMIARSRGLH